MNIRFYLNIVFLILLASLVVLFQYSIISLWPYPFYLINLIIPSLIILFLTKSNYSVWVFAISSAIILDFLYFNFLGLNLIIIFVIVFLMQMWLRNWFAKLSIYSFIVLAVLSVLIKNIIYYGFVNISLIINLNFWQDMLWEILWTVLLTIIFFYLSLKINKNLKPAFLGRRPLS